MDGDIFYNPLTIDFTAQVISRDSPDIKASLWGKMKLLFPIFFKNYILSSYLLLLPAILLISAALSKKIPSLSEFPVFFKKKKNELIFLGFVFIISFLGTLFAHFYIFYNYPTISDEYVNVFQADILASGLLYAPAPPVDDSFKSEFIINDSGKWYGKYTIGWALLIAAGKILHVEFLVGSLLSALSAVFIYLIGRNILDFRAGLIATVLYVASPYFIFLGGTYFPHTAFGFFMLLAIWALDRTYAEDNMLYPVIAGLTLGYLPNIRAGDAFVIFVVTLTFVIYSVIKAPGRRSAILKTLVIFLFSLVGVGLLLYVNNAQTGSPFLFAFNKYASWDKWGFGVQGHTPLRGLWNVTYSLMRNCFWTAPLIMPFTFLSAFRRDFKLYFLLFITAGYILFYFCFFSLGNVEIGARYLMPGFLVMLVPSAAGLLWLQEKMIKKGYYFARTIILVFLTIVLIFSFSAIFPHAARVVKKVNSKLTAAHMAIENPPQEVKSPSVIFVWADGPVAKSPYFIRNSFRYNNEKHISVLFLTPEENKKVLRHFPDRTPYMAVFDPKAYTFRFSPMDNTESAVNYRFAGYNYQWGVHDNKKAEKAYLRGLALEPDNAKLAVDLANLYIAEKKYDKAVEVLEKLVDKFPAAYYFIGRFRGEAGNIAGAKEAFKMFIEKNPNSPLVENAKKWMIKFH